MKWHKKLMNEMIISNFLICDSFAPYFHLIGFCSSSMCSLCILLECIVAHCSSQYVCEWIRVYVCWMVILVIRIGYSSIGLRCCIVFQCDICLHFMELDRFLSWFEIGSRVNHVTVNRITTKRTSWLPLGVLA